MAHDLHGHAGAGKPVLVTGASSGIGEACLDVLQQAGFLVLAGVRSPEAAQAIHQRHAGRVHVLRFDVANGEQVRTAVRDVRAALGGRPLWGLVNGAGMAIPGPVELLDDQSLLHQFGVNVFGPVALIQACLGMLRESRGRIVNMSSINGLVAKPYIGAYCASKHALEALSDSLRMEVAGWGIHVVLVEPGSVKTPLWGKGGEAVRALASQAPPDVLAPYAAVLGLLARSASVRGDVAPSLPVDVAHAVLKALTDAAPRARYVVGRDARWQAAILRRLPTAIRDALILRKLKVEGSDGSDRK